MRKPPKTRAGGETREHDYASHQSIPLSDGSDIQYKTAPHYEPKTEAKTRVRRSAGPEQNDL